MMFGRGSARDAWLEVSNWSSDQEHRVARRKAAFHRRHFLAQAHEWALALLVVAISFLLAAFAALAVLH